MRRRATAGKPDAKSRNGPATVDEYLDAVPQPARDTLQKLRAAILAAAPAETTEAISYGLPTFKYKGSLLAIGAFSDHCNLFPMNPKLLDRFEKELRSFSKSKGTIRFSSEKSLLVTLVRKLVKARVTENEFKVQRAAKLKNQKQ